MKKIILLAMSMLLVICIVPTYAGKPTPGPQQVEVVNAPLDVNVVNQSSDYEYKVFRIESGEVAEAVVIFQTEINTNASAGWEFVSFSYQQTPSPTHIYVGIMKRPIP